MPKLIVIQMEQHFPFGQSDTKPNQNTTILVKKSYQYHNSNQYEAIKNWGAFKKIMNHKSLIKTDHSLQEDGSIHFYFQYVPIKLQQWLFTINPLLINQLKQQMKELTNHLSKFDIKVQFHPENIGLDQNMSLKYYLGDFDPNMKAPLGHFDAVKACIDYYFSGFEKSNKQKQITPSAQQNLYSSSKFSQAKQNQSKESKFKSLEDKIKESKLKSLDAIKKIKKMQGN